MFQIIGIAKEVESPENPGALEKRAALLPSDVNALVNHGCEVYFEEGLGEGLGIDDQEYKAAGAVAQPHRQVYSDKDLVIKFKGPPLEAIPWMRPGSTLFCMAHFRSFPDRAQLLEDRKINVVAMEFILDAPKQISDEIILSKVAISHFLKNLDHSVSDLKAHVVGYSSAMVGGIRRIGNREMRQLNVWSPEAFLSHDLTGNDLVFYDSSAMSNELGQAIGSKGATYTIDLAAFERLEGAAAIAQYRREHPPFPIGLRRIQCLHETGQAGARYGLRLLREESWRLKNRDLSQINAVVFGFGNVGMGAIDEIYAHGVNRIHVLTKRTTQKGTIEQYLEDADLIVNGAEQPPALRGKNFLLTRDHVKNILKPGTVVIDLVGGSSSNRSPIENVVDCTFLTRPHFIEDDVYFAALWGWPMMGMFHETARKYSRQIRSVLIEREQLIKGLHNLHPGVEPALVCGPFDV